MFFLSFFSSLCLLWWTFMAVEGVALVQAQKEEGEKEAEAV